MPRPRRRGRDPISDIIRALRRLRLPKLGPVVSLVGVSGYSRHVAKPGDCDLDWATRAVTLTHLGKIPLMRLFRRHPMPPISFEATPLVGWQGRARHGAGGCRCAPRRR
jgi:hypothetical protein